jgi:TonB-linked SusC/RagA family outer membrane protein
MKFYALSKRPRRRGLEKIILMMKLTMILMIAACMQLHATGFSQNVSLAHKNASLEKIFRDINRQTGYLFLCTEELLKKSKTITLHVNNVSLQDALDLCFRDQPFTYAIVEKTIVVQQKNETAIRKPAAPVDVEVRGKIMDPKGVPVPNVSILIKGTTSGVTSDANGDFILRVPDENAVLVISSIGYVPQEIPVRNRSDIRVTLETDLDKMEGIVVTALGISKQKKSLAYSVTDVKGDDFTRARENNIGNALSGRIAGVNATATATGPGGSSRVIIRGNGSLSGENQPLYVVNGVPINNAVQGTPPGTYGGIDKGDGLISINPDDIETISVLKGGTAAALYGSRAANGVILITTKSGKAQKGIGVEYTTAYTLENPLSIPDWQYVYGSGSRGDKPTSKAEAVANGRISWGAKLDGSPVVNPDGVERPYSAQKKNIKNFYDNGSTFSNTLALNGGNETANFRFSVSNMENKGIVPSSSVNRKTFNLSANANLGKKVIFEGAAQYNIEENKNRTYIADFTKNPNAAVGLVATNIDVRTLAPGYDENNFETEWSDYVFVVNPYFAVNKVRNSDERRRFIGSFSTRYNILDFLYARARVGIDYFNINSIDIDPTGLLYNPTGSMTAGSSTTYETNAEALLGFDKKFGMISVNVIAGGNKMHNKLTGEDFSSGLFNVPFVYFTTNGSAPSFVERFRESAINSLFASADIGYNNSLFLSLTGRKDWFSTLAPQSNSLFYPSVGISFVFSDVWKEKPVWLSYGKVRASWAEVGGGAPDPYKLSLAYAAPSSSHLGQPLMYISGNTIPNLLKPYTSTTTELGIEFKLFKNRLSTDITLYNRSTTNDIVEASVPLSSGYRSVALNVGKMENKGIELLLTGTPVNEPKGFSWEVSYNMAYNKNTVVKIADGLTSLALPGAEARTNNGFVYHFEGMPFGMISGYKGERDVKGNLVFNKENGIPVQGDFVALGRGVPPLTMALSNNFQFKNFNLGFMIDGKFGAKMYTSTNAYGTYYGLHKRTVENNVRETGVEVQGVDTDGNPFSQTVPAQEYFQGIAFSLTDEFVSDAGFVKLRQLIFGYNLPQKILSRTPFQHVNISLVGRNLLLLYSQVKNVDPESNYNNSNAQGLENFGVPPVRSYGINVIVRL